MTHQPESIDIDPEQFAQLIVAVCDSPVIRYEGPNVSLKRIDTPMVTPRSVGFMSSNVFQSMFMIAAMVIFGFAIGFAVRWMFWG